MKPEYRFDYSAAKPNRFAGRIQKGSVAVLLDPDVAQLFKDTESVNAVLRAPSAGHLLPVVNESSERKIAGLPDFVCHCEGR